MLNLVVRKVPGRL